MNIKPLTILLQAWHWLYRALCKNRLFWHNRSLFPAPIYLPEASVWSRKTPNLTHMCYSIAAFCA